jgi:pyruvate/2-oxoglutarate dehydrogenase complex dihydrolipoamide acyltransferase (E2) component
MAFEFRLPDIGEGLAEAEVVGWMVEPGQRVGLDAPLVEVETDKAVTVIPAPRAGVLLHRGAPAGSTVRVGDVLAVIGEPGEQWSQGPEPERAEPAPIVGTLEEPHGPGTTESVGEEVRALPAVRRLARELAVDLRTLRGTGPGGAITREDVEGAAGPSERRPSGPEERVRLSGLRRKIAERMERSWREIPHVTTFGEADATRLVSTRRELMERRGGPAPYEALFIRAVVPALREFPEFNAALDGEVLVRKRHYDIGVAIDTPEGLIVAVVKAADRLDLPALADEVTRLGEATRGRTVPAADLAGATFTVSNIGAVGGGHGTPIIPFGTTAILSFGRIEDRPVARDGRPAVALLLPLSLSYDHRVIDGALGRRFLGTVIDGLENPPPFAPA